MGDDAPSINVRMEISREQADDFLYRAAHDPDFRARVEADPATALREFGVEIGDEATPHLAQLPDPEDIEELRKRLAGGGDYAKVGSAAGPAWFMVLAWFFNVPKPGGDAAS